MFVLRMPQHHPAETGKEIGFHDGAVFHTLGERHGFTITQKSPTDGAYYIVSKDIKKNILYVSQINNFFEKDKENFSIILTILYIV